ncbi:CAP domain-containing protein [Guptibacillus hwajinpoensis]|uniref:CAP domain-containing protein n=1 Tax=Guptibacillus hwajinpoensis TaxID=208199 RepID=UPI001CD2B1D6|nr:CAP domain-containing protein [Pseudalkalibacillus hwajinpoensis]MCA0990533.1 CAP domain-containing protein [Pseudalkalibacillus hwajinpoensis]
MYKKIIPLLLPGLLLLGACNANNNDEEALNINKTSAPTEGIQRINSGQLTIDPNSYSTETPSAKFPHGEMVQDGQFEFNEVLPNVDPREYLPEGFPEQYGIGGKEEQQRQQKMRPDQNTGQAQPNENPAPEQEEANKEKSPTSEPSGEITKEIQQVIDLTNAERKEQGLSPLKAMPSLSDVAQEKSRDMQQKNYFSHTSPTYGSPFDMMRDFGVDFNTAGENIAQGQQTPEAVVDAWMKSEGHRKNIMNSSFTHIGVGLAQDGHYWTQMFIGK